MTSRGPADLFETTVCWFDSPGPTLSAAAELQYMTTGHQKPLYQQEVCQILSCCGLHVWVGAYKPALKGRQQKKCVAFAKVYRLQKGWTVVPMNHPFNCILITAYTTEDLLENTHSQDSPRKHSSLVEEKSWFGVTSSMEDVPEICRVHATSTAWSIETFLLHFTKLNWNSSAGWHSFSFFSLHIKVPESIEGQGAPGLVSPVISHQHYWACLDVIVACWCIQNKVSFLP